MLQRPAVALNPTACRALADEEQFSILPMQTILPLPFLSWSLANRIPHKTTSPGVCQSNKQLCQTRAWTRDRAYSGHPKGKHTREGPVLEGTIGQQDVCMLDEDEYTAKAAKLEWLLAPGKRHVSYLRLRKHMLSSLHLVCFVEAVDGATILWTTPGHSTQACARTCAPARMPT